MLTVINFITTLIFVVGLGALLWEDRDYVLQDKADWAIGIGLSVAFVGNIAYLISKLVSFFGA